MTRTQIDRAITRLRELNRESAGREAQDVASRLLPLAAQFKTPADMAALWVTAVTLYYAAATRSSQETGAATFAKIVQRRYELLLQRETAVEDALGAGIAYPEQLDNLMRAVTASKTIGRIGYGTGSACASGLSRVVPLTATHMARRSAMLRHSPMRFAQR